MLGRKKFIVCLFIVIFIQVIYFGYLFSVKKVSFHSDEAWSYGYSNAYYLGQIFWDENEDKINCNEWLDGKLFRDYLQVNSDQRFSYGSVVYNISADVTTCPLYYMILHTVCSFFPDSFSWWYGFSINLVALVIMMIFYFLLLEKMLNSTWGALIGTIFLGLSTGCISWSIFIRSYALLVMFTVIEMYLHLLLYKAESEKKNKILIMITLVTCLGGLTQYFFFVYFFFVAAFLDLHYLVRKQFKNMILYSVSMLSGVIFSFLLWPKAILDALNSGNAYSNGTAYTARLKYVLNLFWGEITGMAFPIPSKYLFACVFSVISILFLLLIAFLFLMRNNVNVRAFIKDLPNKLKRLCRKTKVGIKNGNKMFWFFTIAMIVTLLIITKVSNVFGMGEYSDRYYFLIMPAISLFISVVVWNFFKVFAQHFKKKVLSVGYAVVLIVLLLSTHVNYPTRYFFDNFGGMSLDERIPEGSDIIFVMNDNWRMIFYSVFFQDKGKILLFENDWLMNSEYDESMLSYDGGNMYIAISADLLKFYDEEGNVVHYVDEAVYKRSGKDYSETDIIYKLLQLPYVNEVEHIGYQEDFCGLVSIYKVK